MRKKSKKPLPRKIVLRLPYLDLRGRQLDTPTTLRIAE